MDSDPAEGGVSGERIDAVFVGEIVQADTGVFLRCLEGNPGSGMTPAVGKADDARHDLLDDFEGGCHLTDSGADPHALAVFELPLLGIIRMHHQGAAIGSTDEPLRIVKPGIVAPKVAPTDQIEALGVCGDRLFSERGKQPLQVSDESLWRSLNLFV